MSSYYYSKLNAQQQAVYNAAASAIRRCELSAKVLAPGIGIEEISGIIRAIDLDHPEFFFVDSGGFKLLRRSAGESMLQISYKYGRPGTGGTADEIEGEIQRVLSQAGRITEASVLDKCRWIHNYLAKNVQYHYAANENPDQYPEAYTVEGVFKHKMAVCGGIAKAVTLLGERLGIDLPYIFGQARPKLSESYGRHAWNLFCVNGVYAHLDVTWDMIWSGARQFTRYDYFGLSDKEISIDHVFDRELVPVCPENSGLSYFERAGRLLRSRRECEQYAEDRFRQGKNLLYFKYRPAKGFPDRIDEKMDSMVMEKAGRYFKSGFRLHKDYNLPFGIFFYSVEPYCGPARENGGGLIGFLKKLL